jgi:hypothetical protein
MYKINHNWSNWKTKVQSSVHSIGGVNKGEKLEFRAKIVKFANQWSK